jgi:heme exporter protein B
MLIVARLVAMKDLKVEWRSRILLWQVLPFAVIALVLAGLAVGPSATDTRRAAPGIFYLLSLLVSLLVISRSRAIESPTGTKTSIATLGLDPAGVFLGKAAAMFVELLFTSLVLLSGVVLLLHAPLGGAVVALPSVVLAAGAVAAGGTIFGALVGDGVGGTTLLPVVALPTFVGVLLAGEKAMAVCFAGGSFGRWLVFLALALVAYTAVGALLYGGAEESA